MFVNKGKITIKIFLLCQKIKNLQKKVNIICQPPISRQPPSHFTLSFLAKIFKPPISINFEKVNKDKAKDRSAWK